MKSNLRASSPWVAQAQARRREHEAAPSAHTMAALVRLAAELAVHIEAWDGEDGERLKGLLVAYRQLPAAVQVKRRNPASGRLKRVELPHLLLDPQRAVGLPTVQHFPVSWRQGAASVRECVARDAAGRYLLLGRVKNEWGGSTWVYVLRPIVGA